MTTTLRIPMHGRLWGAAAAFALALAAPLAWAQGAAKNAVQSIDFSSVQGGKVVVKIGMKEPLAAVPQAFTVTNPPRVAIELPETVNGQNRTQLEASEGDLRRTYHMDCQLLKECDIIFAVPLDRDPGTLVEVGMAIEMDKPVITYDPRHENENTMVIVGSSVYSADLDVCLNGTFNAIAELRAKSR